MALGEDRYKVNTNMMDPSANISVNVNDLVSVLIGNCSAIFAPLRQLFRFNLLPDEGPNARVPGFPPFACVGS